jgi:Fatty acid hydroxylase superfamily
MAVSVLLPLALPASWFERSLRPDAELGVVGGTVVGYLSTTLAVDARHRAAHAVPPLWRVFHQMHHAPRRLGAVGALVFHPSEAALYTLLGAGVNVMLLGLDRVAASIVGFLGSFNALFQHANLRTPRALGWPIQRSEAHSIDHAVHGFIYSDLPQWDMLFGSYRCRPRLPAAGGLRPRPLRRGGATPAPAAQPRPPLRRQPRAARPDRPDVDRSGGARRSGPARAGAARRARRAAALTKSNRLRTGPARAPHTDSLSVA